ncbi:unnamed protein product [Mytilus edulis]|uniref:Fibronectin type-III domain-containing protein n=1 Tax=Mytilus edulis TaxID=6550 RepID=A0A8S3RHV6_MYTED|nr:unnamed protein product [Mytilus edulis]
MDLFLRFVGIWIVCFVYIAVGVEGADYGAACTGDGTGDCKETTNIACDTTCKCAAGFFRKGGTECAARVALKATCVIADTSPNQCVADTECKDDGKSAKKCLCKATHYESSSACKPRIVPGVACAAHQCVTHATCNTTSNKCKCDAGFNATPTTKPTMLNGNWSSYKIEWKNCSKACGSDPPEDIKNQTQTSSSIFLNIIPANINHTSFLVYVRSAKLETNSTNYTVVNLDAAECYNISVFTKFGDTVSSQAIHRNFCTTPVPPSSIEIFTQTNDSLIFNITHGAGLFDHFNISLDGKYKISTADLNSTFTIAVFGGLSSGTLYKNISVRSISNNTLSVPTQPIEHTTNSNPPSNVHVQNQNDTSVTLSIARESGKFDKLFVWIERVNIYVETPHTTKIIIGGLEPGNQYLAIVGTTSNGLNSTAYYLTINTNPDRPIAVYLLNRTTESLGIKIVQGQGMTEWFHIQINHRYNVKGKINQTELVLEKLTPGQMYSDIKVQAVSHGLFGESIIMNDTSTIPDAPSLVQVSDKTTETLIIMIVHGKGIVELFHIDIDGKNHSQKATSDSNTTYVTIGHLTPGTLYKDITIYSISNRLESDARKIDASATYPSSPSLQVKDNSINVIRIVIMKGSGGVEKYKILVNNEEVINVTYNQSSQEVNITDRVPGKMYNITAKAIANNIESNLSSNIQQATYPSSPSLHVQDNSINALRIVITKGSGGVEKNIKLWKTIIVTPNNFKLLDERYKTSALLFCDFLLSLAWCNRCRHELNTTLVSFASASHLQTETHNSLALKVYKATEKITLNPIDIKMYLKPFKRESTI